MNKLFVFFYMLLSEFAISCNSHNMDDDNVKSIPANAKAVEISLIDSLGTLSLAIPVSYDTSFTWIHYSDCGKACDEQKYRFQPTAYPIVKETGWYAEDFLRESVNRLTVSHSRLVLKKGDDVRIDSIRHMHFKDKLAANSMNPPIVFDTIQNVNNRLYSIVVMDKSDSLFSKRVIAATLIKGNLVTFQYELLTRNNDSVAQAFIGNSIMLLRTIKIY